MKMYEKILKKLLLVKYEEEGQYVTISPKIDIKFVNISNQYILYVNKFKVSIQLTQSVNQNNSSLYELHW